MARRVRVAAGAGLLCFGDGPRYNAVFSFGDSLADTGNICVNKSATEQLLLTFANPPYGMTYFGHPTCRCSDGRLVVDFIAQALGLPLLPPSKRTDGVDFRQGANMAIVGATALDFEFFKRIGLGYPIWNNGAMNVQIQWFQQLLPSICCLHRGPSQELHAEHRGQHRQRRRETDSPRRGGHRRPGGPPDRLLRALPHDDPERQQGRLRRSRLPQAAQRALHLPERAAPEQARRPPRPARAGGEDRVRRLLRDAARPAALRLRRRRRGVLRRRRREVQLPVRRPLRHEGRRGVPEPGRPRVVGRHPPHGGDQQAGRRRMAQGTLLSTSHPAMIYRCAPWINNLGIPLTKRRRM